MEEDELSVEENAGAGIPIARMVSFSDGVFAVAITLLVLSIDVPVLPKTVADEKLPQELLKMMPIFWAYVVSFLVIGLFWIGHHRIFRHFTKHDEGILWLNIVFLMTVVFIPFTTSLQSDYSGSRVGLIFYACSIAVPSILLCLLFWYGIKRGLVPEGSVDKTLFRRTVFGYLDCAAVFLLSIPISFWSTSAAKFFWLIILPSNLIFDHYLVHRMWKE